MRHQIVRILASQHEEIVGNFEGAAIPRIGEYLEYGTNWYRVSTVLWRRRVDATMVATLVVDQVENPYPFR